jgi:hypothetical protein
MRDKDPTDGHGRLPLFAEDSNRSLKFVPTFPDPLLQLGRLLIALDLAELERVYSDAVWCANAWRGIAGPIVGNRLW